MVPRNLSMATEKSHLAKTPASITAISNGTREESATTTIKTVVPGTSDITRTDNNTRPRKATTDVLGDHSHLLNRVWSLHWRISWMLFPLESKSGHPPFLRSMGGSSWLDQSQC
ncbi:hypothetical protein NXF25_004652 [Crotalus adamanteus]|uniref:Uncharacterized protein n=1 Tax=Crotalus adamanteus TaxID=8729 RepID=A0AAW1BV48_CROAD